MSAGGGPPRRPGLLLLAAAAYDVAFAAWLALSPESLFGLVGAEPPWPAWFGLLLAVVIAAAGAVFAAGARVPRWRRLAVGVLLLTKTLPPLAWLAAVLTGAMPAKTWPFVVADDVAWWWPLALLVTRERRTAARARRPD